MISLQAYNRAVERDERIKGCPYLSGMRACAQGASRTTCPHALDTHAAAEWYDGYNHQDDLFSMRGI